MSDLASPSSAALEIRVIDPDDVRFISSTWKESHKNAPKVQRLPWEIYHQTVSPVIDALIAQSRILAAYHADGRIIGWLAYAPGRSISTVHWAFTRKQLHLTTCPSSRWTRDSVCNCEPEKLRRRGVMAMLLDAAEIGKRFAYTLQGARRNARGHGAASGPSSDVAIVEWLRGRGISATYVPLKEWLK